VIVVFRSDEAARRMSCKVKMGKRDLPGTYSIPTLGFTLEKSSKNATCAACSEAADRAGEKALKFGLPSLGIAACGGRIAPRVRRRDGG
jgi:hypothetical protein